MEADGADAGSTASRRSKIYGRTYEYRRCAHVYAEKIITNLLIIYLGVRYKNSIGEVFVDFHRWRGMLTHLQRTQRVALTFICPWFRCSQGVNNVQRAIHFVAQDHICKALRLKLRKDISNVIDQIMPSRLLCFLNPQLS